MNFTNVEMKRAITNPRRRWSLSPTTSTISVLLLTPSLELSPITSTIDAIVGVCLQRHQPLGVTFSTHIMSQDIKVAITFFIK
jgi:hypothetical protein